jgi:flagellar hook protein FlgE
MLRSLFSGISGMRAHQTMLDVTGNNIANVNTTGFKSSQVLFQDALSQELTSASAPQGSAGGSNPAQVGLGVRIAGITTNFAQGSSQATGRAQDMMINGDGFFVVRKGNDTFYTRSGAFDFDSTGEMVLPGEGAVVQGWPAVNGVVDTTGPLGDLSIPVGTLMPAKATTQASVIGNLPADTAVGGTLQRTITEYAADGTERTLALTFTRTAAGWDMAATDGTATLTTPIPVAFAADGSLDLANSGLGTGGTFSLGGVTVDLSKVTGYTGVDSLRIDTQDGYTAGQLQSFALGSDGTITGSFSNGLNQVLGRIALGSFANPGGLEKAGGSLYAASANSGAAQIGTSGSGGRGTLSGGYLEMSNVDLSSEFTNLIVAQRGFQANARVITTSDDVLQELVNLKR